MSPTAVTGKWHRLAVAGPEDGVCPTCEGVATYHIERESGRPGPVPGCPIRPKTGLCQPRIHHAHGVEGRFHPEIDGLVLREAGARVELDVPVLSRLCACARVLL